jgi:hypothetical protein
MVVRFKPSRIIEVGSGQSLLVSAAAVAANKAAPGGDKAAATEITVIEPYPDQPHNKHLLSMEHIGEVVVKKIQDVDIEYFKKLGDGDLLFLDSSHVVATSSDTVHEFLKILPELKPGVIVHIHDIFLYVLQLLPCDAISCCAFT